MLGICSASAVENALNRRFGVKDFSAVMTDEYDEVWDSFFARCICWDRVQRGDFWNEQPKRIYVWRAFYGLINDPTKSSSQQQNSPNNNNQVNPSQSVSNVGQSVGNVGSAVGPSVSMPLGLTLGILELTSTTTATTTTTRMCSKTIIKFRDIAVFE
jgi:hypothetical protein